MKPVTLIVSDLHVGGGPQDPGDDHVYDNGELTRFLDQQCASQEGQRGDLELVFNGDFLEFAQTNPAAFHHVSDRFWCTAAESLVKLETILAGHPDIFHALARFQSSGNLVTIAAGNHDVDLAWPAVQQRLREAAGASISFEIGCSWVERYSGLLQIGHGHMHDVANRFVHWDQPIRIDPQGTRRLEMCPGTMFMVKFVNALEADYPFADNLLPISKLFAVLMKEDKAGLGSVAWLFMKMIGSSSLKDLSAAQGDDIERRLLSRAAHDVKFRMNVAQRLADAGESALKEAWNKAPISSTTLQAAMLSLLGRLANSTWQALFDARGAGILAPGNSNVTLNALRKAAFEDGKLKLRTVARDRAIETDARVVVLGHTHQPDEVDLPGGARYLNPGCWTRYLEIPGGKQPTLDELKDERAYPYQLNYVRVEEPGPGGALHSAKICFERSQN